MTAFVKSRTTHPTFRGNSGKTVVKVRSMRLRDARRIATLSTQLGYPVTTRKMSGRIKGTAHQKNHKLYVSELNGTIVGWLEIFLPLSVLNAGKAEIGALVVDENYRRCGSGRALMEAAHAWARQKKCPFIYLRSNVTRKGAHEFYKRTGYTIFKTQYVFRSLLPKTTTRNIG